MKQTDHKNGTPSVARRPRLVCIYITGIKLLWNMNVMSLRSYTNLGRWSWRLCGLRSILIFSTKVIALLSQRFNLHHPINPYNNQLYNQRTVLCLKSKHTAAAEPYIHGKIIFSASLMILITFHVWFHLYKPWNIPLIKRSNFCYSKVSTLTVLS